MGNPYIHSATALCDTCIFDLWDFRKVKLLPQSQSSAGYLGDAAVVEGQRRSGKAMMFDH